MKQKKVREIYVELRDDNNNFSKAYEKSEKLKQLKNKYQQRMPKNQQKEHGELFINELIKKYQAKGFKIPNLSVKNNIFEPSPLLTENDKIYDLYKFKKHDDIIQDKNLGFLEKLQNIATERIAFGFEQSKNPLKKGLKDLKKPKLFNLFKKFPGLEVVNLREEELEKKNKELKSENKEIKRLIRKKFSPKRNPLMNTKQNSIKINEKSRNAFLLSDLTKSKVNQNEKWMKTVSTSSKDTNFFTHGKIPSLTIHQSDTSSMNQTNPIHYLNTTESYSTRNILPKAKGKIGSSNDLRSLTKSKKFYQKDSMLSPLHAKVPEERKSFLSINSISSKGISPPIILLDKSINRKQQTSDQLILINQLDQAGELTQSNYSKSRDKENENCRKSKFKTKERFFEYFCPEKLERLDYGDYNEIVMQYCKQFTDLSDHQINELLCSNSKKHDTISIFNMINDVKNKIENYNIPEVLKNSYNYKHNEELSMLGQVK
jgi:hypothetical protein